MRVRIPFSCTVKNSKVETMQQPFEVWVSLMLSVRYSDLAHVT